MSSARADAAFREFLVTGAPEALGAVFDEAAPRLLLLAAHLAPRGADAEDLLQSTFVEAIASAHTFDRARPVMPWLMGILAHQARRTQRAQRRQLDTARLRTAASIDPHEVAEQHELVAAFEAAMDDMSPALRRFLVLHLVHGLSHAQIAQSEGCPPGTVKSRLRRGLARLREVLPAGFAASAMLFLSASGIAAVRAHVLRAVPTPAAPPLAATTTTAPTRTVRPLPALASTVAILCFGAIIWSATFASADSATSAPPTDLAPTPAPPPVSLAAPSTREPLAPAPPSSALATLHAHLTWQSDGSVASGIPVLLLGAPDRAPDDIAVTDASGRVTFAGLASGSWLIAAAPTRARVIDAVRIAPGSDVAALIATGPWQIAATAEAATNAALAAGADTTVALALPSFGVIDGIVTDLDGKPVRDARIFAAIDPTEPFGGDTGVRSDEAGAFSLRMWSRWLSVHARSVGMAPSDAEFVPAPGPDATVHVRLIAGGARGDVAGTVRTADGRACPDLLVSLLPREQRNDERPPNPDFPRFSAPQLARTDRDGAFRFADVPVGTTILRVLATDARARKQVKVAKDDTAYADLHLAPAPAPAPAPEPPTDPAPTSHATGHLLTDTSAPPTHPVLELVDSATGTSHRVDTIAADGRFHTGPLPPSTYHLLARDGDGPWTPLGAHDITRSDTDLGVLQLGPQVPVALTVRPARGALPWDLHVHVLAPDGTPLQHGRVREHPGAIDLPPLAAGRYLVQVGGSDVSWVHYSLDLQTGIPCRGEIVLPRGEACRIAFALPEASSAALVRVRIVDASGNRTVQAVLFASEVAAGLRCGLPVGTYTVTAETADGGRGECAIAVTEQSRVFRVELR